MVLSQISVTVVGQGPAKMSHLFQRLSFAIHRFRVVLLDHENIGAVFGRTFIVFLPQAILIGQNDS